MLQHVILFFAVWGVVSFIKTVAEIAVLYSQTREMLKEIDRTEKENNSE